MRVHDVTMLFSERIEAFPPIENGCDFDYHTPYSIIGSVV